MLAPWIVLESAAGRAEETAKLLRALANAQRLLILCYLHRMGEVGAGELAHHFAMAPSALSQHLARMREVSLIVQSRDGRSLRYRLSTELDARLPALLDSLCATGAEADAANGRAARAATVMSLALDATMGVDPAEATVVRGPAITGAGRFYALPDVGYEPDPAIAYKAVFALTLPGNDVGKVNPALEGLARVVNACTRAGIPPAKLKLTAVVYGRATPLALADRPYNELFGVPNPNLPVIHELRAHDIDVAVCGQAVMGMHYRRAWIDPGITTVSSALVVIIELGQKGYVLVQM